MWTETSYNALYDWLINSKRDKVRKVLRADGLQDVIRRLDSAPTSATMWYQILDEATKAVGPDVVARRTERVHKNVQKNFGRALNALNKLAVKLDKED